MKRIVSLVLGFMLLLSTSALADREVIISPSLSDFSINDLREYAVSFFSTKCGLDIDFVRNAKIEISLIQNESLHVKENGSKEWGPAGDPYWRILITSFPRENAVLSPHNGYHSLYLTRDGLLISWSAHGSDFYEDDPDIIMMGSKAIPLEMDAQESDIIQQVQNDLIQIYKIENSDTFTYKASFLYEEHFNNGSIPVWVVYVYQNNRIMWKGVYSYNGAYMSLVPAKQDFTCYTTEGENYFVSVYGDHWWEEASKYAKIHDGEASEQETNEWIAFWQPSFDAWISNHPYSTQGKEMEALLQRYITKDE